MFILWGLLIDSKWEGFMKFWWRIIILLAMPYYLAALAYVPNQIIFKTSIPRQIIEKTTGLEEFDSFLSEKDIKNINPVLKKTQNRYFVASFDSDINWDELANLQFEGIEYIQPNYINSFYVEPNDPEYNNQQVDFENCNIPPAWNYTTGNGEIIVGIVDSGIHFDHPDLQNNIYINANEIPDDGIDNDGNGYIDDWQGWDFVDAPELYTLALGDYTVQDNDPSDDLNHGTHIAGIIGADANNQEGVCGICWNVKLLVIRSGFNTVDGGYLQDDDAAAGIIYAADMGADVISLSWGDINFSQIIADACYYAYEHGCTIAAAAGNEGSTNAHLLTYPARLSTTLSVGAVDKYKQLASFSSYGPELDLVAPGQFIISTYDVTLGNLYQEQSGTSMSAPFVAAGIALLLSIEPGLNYEEIRGRLISSALDLGDPGFDNVYGNGMLNVQELLTNLNYPVIEISYPLDNAGLNDDFDIIGTVQAPSFWRYSVQYTSAPMPTPLDWEDVDPDISYYDYEVENDIIASFWISNYFPDNTYKIKVEIFTSTNESYSYLRTITIDQSPPIFQEQYAAIMKRYNEEISEYYLQAVFDENVFLSYREAGSGAYLPVSNYADSIQIFNPMIFSGTNLLDIKAVNVSGLETEVYNAYQYDPEIEYIDLNSFTQTELGNELVAIRKMHDFDGNGKNEFVALEIVDDTLKIFELDYDELITKHKFAVSFLPDDMGDTNGQGIEVLGRLAGIPIIYEVTTGLYPDFVIYPADDAFGVNFADVNGDGIDELALIKNVDIGVFTHRVLVLYNRSGNEFTAIDTIINQTATFVRNEFVNKVACGNLDGDSYPDLLTADKDGDVMIFENTGSGFEMTWNIRLPVTDAHYLAMGDFTGDGNNEFCAGGFIYNAINPNKTFLYFGFFKNTGTNDQYEPAGYISFTQVETKNSIAAADLDGNGDEEIILSVPPNTYIIDYIDGEFIPIWKGVSAKTEQHVITACSETVNEDAFIIVNSMQNGEIGSSLIKVAEEFTGPPTPCGFYVIPQDSTTVFLGWETDPSFEYNIYRQEEGIPVLIANTQNNSYQDSGLTTGDTLYYRITAEDTSYSPPESLPTAWKSAVPYYKPKLQYVKMISPYTLKVKFNQQLAFSATHISNYIVTPINVNPISVNMLEQNTCLILRFRESFEDLGEDYVLYYENLSGITGVPIAGNQTFPYQPDTISPEIVDVKNENLQIVNIYFSEPVKAQMAEDISNYTLVLPAVDKNNEIETLEYKEGYPDSFYVSIKMKKNLEYTNQPYFLKIDNVEDQAGNKISVSGNKCHFSLTAMIGLKNLKHLRVYPNPLNKSESEFDVVNFINLPLEVSGKLRIFNLSGELIFEKKVGPYYNPIDFFSWECRNNGGKEVSSGIYFYILQMGNDAKKGKIVLIN
ncbi:MAG: S8 family serine peptidase [Candidatus Cloacimonetes bacterium]|nr:S8 family serine peptidase [Candidatus Cloacimonadota bacterium]